MASIETFEQLRPRLIGIAYRMLGAATEAEDAVQDGWLRWHEVDEGEIRDPGAWLATVVSRLCIDRLTSARARREAYPGPWLPEPVVTEEPVDVESISLGFLGDGHPRPPARAAERSDQPRDPRGVPVRRARAQLSRRSDAIALRLDSDECAD